VTPPGTGGASTTIAIVGVAGAQSFNPDPASVATGATFAWKNNDGVTHHIVFDDGSMDSGNLAPGATSAVMTLRSTTAKYHCTIHPSMVGAINTAAPDGPPCQGVYCDSAK
jgi:plastocyanin